MGPMITKKDRDRMFVLIDDAIKKGGILLAGGKIPKGKRRKLDSTHSYF